MTNLVISCPASSRSGYGDHSRDLIRSLIAMNKYDIKILDTKWGACGRDALGELDKDISSRFIDKLTSKPDVWIQVTIPNEFQAVGKYNIGITAGIETDICSAPWVQGMNRMDYCLVPSEHSKKVLEDSIYNENDAQGNAIGKLKLETKTDVLFEGLDITKYRKTNDDKFDLSSIKESFCFLSVGHWLNGDFTHDRKDMGGMIRTFMETFKNTKASNQPALILKTSAANFSVRDREAILKKIEQIKATVDTSNVPNVYLVHGQLTQKELNGLYNHPKVKAMVSFTHGEGFGRPLLEFSVTGKPTIAPSWSGHVDFLSQYGIPLAGKLETVHKSVVWKDIIVDDARWFYVDYGHANGTLKKVWKDYKKVMETTRKQTQYVKDNFTMEIMDKKFQEFVDANVPSFEIKIPTLDDVKVASVK
jgi:hypothetical protein